MGHLQCVLHRHVCVLRMETRYKSPVLLTQWSKPSHCSADLWNADSRDLTRQTDARRWKRRKIMQPRLSDRAYISFIPSHTSQSVNLLSVCVSFRLQRGFLSLELLENCCQPRSSKTSCSFVVPVCSAESEINCTFIAQPDERLGKCSAVINRTLLQIAALRMASCAGCLSCSW